MLGPHLLGGRLLRGLLRRDHLPLLGPGAGQVRWVLRWLRT